MYLIDGFLSDWLQKQLWTQTETWHSGNLEEVYHKDKKLTYDSLNERQLLNQWLHFQMSGQGPYFGQCGW